MDFLLWTCVGVLILLATACMIVVSWRLEDRKFDQARAARASVRDGVARDWYRQPDALKGHPHVRANRDRGVV